MAERVVIFRPNRPIMPNGALGGPNAGHGGTTCYLVTQAQTIVAQYHLYYFRTPGEVVADLLDMLKTGRLAGPWEHDYAVWFSGRLQVAIHQPMDHEQQRIIWFNEEGNAPRGVGDIHRWAGWPPYEQWVANGKGDIDFDLEKYSASY